jgi:hypothetical protein
MLIDRKLFTGVDQIKHSSAFQQVLAPIDTLPHDTQTLINRGISLAIPILPSLIFALMLILNISARFDLQKKQDLLNRMDEITKLSSKAMGYGNVLVAPVTINTKQDFETRVNSLAKKNQIGSGLISVKSFKKEQMGSLGKSNVSLSFRDFSTIQFTKFLNQLMIDEKVKIGVVSLSKTNSLLTGTLNLIHFAKSTPAPTPTPVLEGTKL